mgnify:CR=1 FL=1
MHPRGRGWHRHSCLCIRCITDKNVCGTVGAGVSAVPACANPPAALFAARAGASAGRRPDAGGNQDCGGGRHVMMDEEIGGTASTPSGPIVGGTPSTASDPGRGGTRPSTGGAGGTAPSQQFWQRDFWDTQLRRGESYSAKWKYVRHNPVRAGLVPSADLWPYQGELNVLRWHE